MVSMVCFFIYIILFIRPMPCRDGNATVIHDQAKLTGKQINFVLTRSLVLTIVSATAHKFTSLGVSGLR